VAAAVHRTIFVVDVEGFGAADRTTPDRVAMRRGLLDAVKTAFREAGVRWRGLHVEDGGDELLVLVPAKAGKAVFVERVPQVLADRLHAYNARHREQARMRLRAAVHAGEVLFHDGKATAPAIIKARRLLDAAELKSALAESDRMLALVSSEWIYDEVVRHGDHAADYRPIHAEVKETSERAWITLPEPAAPAKRSWVVKRRTPLLCAVAVIVVLAVAVPVVLKLPAAAPAQSLLGDPRTADPCALTYAEALSAYGLVETSDHYGNFDRCDAMVYLTKDREQFVDVRVDFAQGEEDASVPVHREGAIGIQRPPAEPDSCTRLLLLPDDEQVVIQADEQGDEKVDLCGMAEAVTSSALVTLRKGQVDRRTLDAGSLASEDACALLDPAVVTAAVGPGPLEPSPSFANWGCAWEYTDRPGVAKVIFDRTAADQVDGAAVPLPGFAGRVQAAQRSDTSCTVSIIYRTYVDEKHEQTDELVLVDVEKRDEPPDRLCEPARRLATTVAQRLSR
jgi:hypothetical protein